MQPITQMLISNNANSRPGIKLRKLKGVVIHWTANTSRTAGALAHARYFQNVKTRVSAHYMVDDKNIIQIIPDDEVAYHVGSRYYKPAGESLRENGLSPNHFLIGIEMCVNPDSVWDDTFENTVNLTRHLLHRHNLSINQLYRHHDITGKDCPKMMVESENEAWLRFLRIVETNVFPDESTPIATGVVNSTTLNIRQGNATFFPVLGTMQRGDSVSIYESVGSWYRIGKDQWVARSLVTASLVSNGGTPGTVNTASLNARSGPSVQNPVVETLGQDQKVTVYNQEGNWYNIGGNKWVHKNFITLANPQDLKGRVNTNQLNVRQGPDTSYIVVGQLHKNETVNILDETNGWIKIGDEQWVNGSFVSVIEVKNGRVTADFLNVRKGPGTNFDVVGRLTRDEKVLIENQESNWLAIGADKWVSANYIVIEDF